MAIEIDKIRTSLLNEAAQDYVGLYEVVWGLGSDQDVSDAEKVAAVRAVVNEVLACYDGHLFRSTTWPPDTYERVPAAEWAAIIASDRSFVMPSDSEPPLIYWIAIGD